MTSAPRADAVGARAAAERAARASYGRILAVIAAATRELIARNGLRSCYIRPLAFRGYGDMGLYAKSAPIEVIIAVWSWGAYLGDEGKRHGIRAKVSS